MHIQKIKIVNFKCFKGEFILDLNPGINILVGINDSGKSTILEAIHLALTGLFKGKYLKYELTQYLFNRQVERDYISSINTESPQLPPSLTIELYFGGEESPNLTLLEGNGNTDNLDCPGVIFKVEFNEDYLSEYNLLISESSIFTIPIEYYKITWKSFSRDSITTRNIPVKTALIDSSESRFQNGSDIYISRIVKEHLDDKERVEISQAHRQMKESFMQESSITTINQKINNAVSVSDKKIAISVDLSTQHAWETSLMTYLDDIPFHYIGKGEQSIIKTNLSLSHKKSQEANVILLEEPENHLSHTKLNEIINEITKNNLSKQLIISTHSSFVANKLGLDNLIFLNNFKVTRLNDLTENTKSFFKKLAGYDTLRLILCEKAILVEGDSDELVIQKAYLIKSGNRLPIEDGIDVISVGTSFKRFLEIACKLDKIVTVVTDNDGDITAVEKKYAEYLEKEYESQIRITYDKETHTGPDNEIKYNTLEPSLIRANSIDTMYQILGKDNQGERKLYKYMQKNKTDCALKIFNWSGEINFPEYINEAVDFNYE